MLTIHVVFPSDREFYQQALIDMYRQRYQVFVEILEWNLPDVDHRNGLEIDAFDHDHAVYLLAMVGDDLIGSTRIIPTTQPHLMSEVFPHLCKNGVPRSPNIWEWSRASLKPNEKRDLKSEALSQQAIAGFDLAMQRGISGFSTQINLADRERWLRRGITASTLGDPVRVDDQDVLALMLHVNAATIAKFRRQVGIDYPVVYGSKGGWWSMAV